MIKLREGQIIDLLPDKIAHDTETRCLSYAIQKEHQRLLDLADGTRTLAVIDQLPERILDVLAVELRTPYYQEDMDIETKRNIIKKTLLWHTKAGTPSAVAELVEIVFGQGKVVEWFNYEEGPFTPGTFDIVTNARLTEEIAAYFLQIIQRVKNTRSHIRRILIEREIEMKERVASGVITSPQEAVLNHKTAGITHTTHRNALTATVSHPRVQATNSPQGRKQSLNGAVRGAVGAISTPKETIGNNVGPRTQSAGGRTYAAAATVASTKMIILNGAYHEAVTIRAATPQVAVGMTSESKITI